MSFYGADDEYVISGSDCGHVFVWPNVRHSPSQQPAVAAVAAGSSGREGGGGGEGVVGVKPLRIMKVRLL